MRNSGLQLGVTVSIVVAILTTGIGWPRSFGPGGTDCSTSVAGVTSSP